ncbi:Lysophospholipid transporter LplT [Vibrio stylophorae]|uniref:Lysophospholipid transporter LplT n=1 Tax=Vibrio stylophorae TaxID=659351 RepID=A0ABN8DS79_9VIBR|nr:MFS transporter [Vibrio stylophorae]CAH0533193.1 Lysophospholipid transporter LplT [Vibrio stylophorae]
MSRTFQLLRNRRFSPYFFTQALGALNDNIFKNCLLILFAYAAPQALGLSSPILTNLAAGLFILPFFLFSAYAGVITDQCEKSKLIRRIKFAEVIIMALAAYAFINQSYWALLLLLFAMGTQSAFFGPVKYALLPQHLKSQELVPGNALVETGTFVAILLGTILASFIAEHEARFSIAAGAVLFFALLGYVCALGIPKAPAAKDAAPTRWRPIAMNMHTLQLAKQDRSIYQAILGISWFWFLGACYLTQIPHFTKSYIGASESAVSILLAFFSIGIALGSLLCDRLSNHRIEIGIVPFGCIGLALFGFDLYFAVPDAPLNLHGLQALLAEPSLYRLFFDLTALGVSGGIFIVPLYALMQQRAKENERAQIIAANNIMNSLFMVGSAGLGIVILGLFGWSIPQFFLLLAGLNALIAAYILLLLPNFALRFVVWGLSHSLYRVRHQDLHHIPEEGGALLICNHVSYMDALLLAGAAPRPLRFVMDREISETPVLRAFFNLANVIPVDANDGTKALRQTFAKVDEALLNGELVCIFPEGQLTYDGDMGPFLRGIHLIIRRSPVPVVPMALRGLWGGFFSRYGGRAIVKWPCRFWSKVTIVAGAPVDARSHDLEDLREIVLKLRGKER